MNRPFNRQSTLCNYTTTGEEIKEGDILGYGDNYACVVFYNTWEARFEAIEFGYITSEDHLYRQHELTYQTTPWEILGNIDDNISLLNGIPKNFDFNDYIKEFYI